MEKTEKMEMKQKGLKINKYFTENYETPQEMFNYERRSSVIKNPDGSVVFSMDNVEVPDFWSQVATDILAQKYFRKAGVPLRNENGDLLLDNEGKVVTGSETSIKEVAHRIAGCWRHWGEKFGYFATEEDAQAFYDEMAYMIISQTAAPNSPQWFTTGLNWAYGLTGPAQGHSYVDPVTKKLEFSRDAYTRSQPHACFIQSLEDDLVRDGGIFSLLTREARIFKYGSGTGSNFSRLRGRGEKLTGGGSSSGLMSFLKIFDIAAGSIKSGGTTRRAAKMVSLNLDHPEVEEFIWWKVREEEKVASLVTGSKIMKKILLELIEAAKGRNNPLENKEVRKLVRLAAKENIPLSYISRALSLAQQGYNLPLQEFDTHYESEAYQTVSGQNSNNSVRIPNHFFSVLENKGDWEFKSRLNGKMVKKISAQKIWDDIGYCAWASADPGIQYDTTINEWHTCPTGGKINGSNPCSEYMFLDDTACNLASINLVKFYDENTNCFDVKGYRHALRLWTIALEISVLMAHFPSEKIAEKSYQYRTLGLGYANIGTLLMLQGIPYDSEEGRTIAGALAAIMTGEAYATSAEMASVLGTFEKYEENRESMLRVIRNHRRAAYNLSDYENLSVNPYPLNQELCPLELLLAAHDAWDKAERLGENYGYRNAQVTVIAPTGTIGLVMDCDTTGVEPDYALVKFKKLSGGGFFKIVNLSVPRALKNLGYSDWEIEEIINYCLGHPSLEDSPYINKESLLRKGLNYGQLEKIEHDLPSTMDINHVFNKWNLGEDFYNKIITGREVSFLQGLGFSDQEIETANDYVCGTMTMEGAPNLRQEHYPVFDCANKCGKKGKRYIHPYGHLKMVSAVQSFISGAISKTINMPKDWTVEQIKTAYYDAWKMMIKGVALYRDGCKLSQPLSSTLSSDLELKSLLEEITEEEKPKIVILKKSGIGCRKLLLKGIIIEDRLKSVEADFPETTPVQETMLKTLLNIVNLGLQKGIMPLEIANHSLQLEGHPVISELRNFLQEFSEMDFSFDEEKNSVQETASSKIIKNKCRSCGASQLRQNGTCLLCEVCGETTGCS